MRYADGVETNDNGRVLERPHCHNEEFSDTAEFCRICGLVAVNYCEGVYYNQGYNNEEPERHLCPSNARYCERCGQQTDFFKLGILRAWNENTETPLNEAKGDDTDDILF